LANSLTIQNIHAGYGAVRVIEDVSMDVAPGKTVVLLGTNGNGKSTLIKSTGRSTNSSVRASRRSSTSASHWCPKAGGCFRS
jgi:branched-chain amino acid transport system ATP-binding protein